MGLICYNLRYFLGKSITLNPILTYFRFNMESESEKRNFFSTKDLKEMVTKCLDDKTLSSKQKSDYHTRLISIDILL